MNLFDLIKEQVTTREAAERYGLKVSHKGMCKCPFHDDTFMTSGIFTKLLLSQQAR